MVDFQEFLEIEKSAREEEIVKNYEDLVATYVEQLGFRVSLDYMAGGYVATIEQGIPVKLTWRDRLFLPLWDQTQVLRYEEVKTKGFTSGTTRTEVLQQLPAILDELWWELHAPKSARKGP